MTQPTVHWREDGTPVSPQYGDVYRSPGQDGHGGLAQARQVFLQGCGLLAEADSPALWSHAAHWAVLETGFGLGLNFLATWQAWLQDGQRPERLFYSAVEAHPPSADDLLRSVAPFAALQPLARELAAQWHGLLPGVHRLELAQGRVQLTLAVGPVQQGLAELSGVHHSLFLDGFNPRLNPEMWSLDTLRAATRLSAPDARAATWCVAASVRQHLQTCGFEVERVPGLPPKRHALRARRVRAAGPAPAPVTPGRCVVVGAGLAGASVACSLAQRGWQVTVLDQAAQPATGASGLPAGVLAPHVSRDDAPLSRLSRAGVRATLASARLLLREGRDFAASGVLELHPEDKRQRPASWLEPAPHPATAPDSLGPEQALTRTQAERIGIDVAQRPALWHAHAGWLRPAALVRAMLQTPGIRWQGGVTVRGVSPSDAGWCVEAENGSRWPAELVVLCAGFGTVGLSGSALPLNALRGQVAFGPMPTEAGPPLPPFPVNGRGSLLTGLPEQDGPGWVIGSTFERASTSSQTRDSDHALNRERLHALLPEAGRRLDAQWEDGRAGAWAGVRATLPDHLPAVGAWAGARENARPDAHARLPLQLLTGLGARGLSLSVLCGELLAAGLHGEPLPLARSLARRLQAARWA